MPSHSSSGGGFSGGRSGRGFSGGRGGFSHSHGGPNARGSMHSGGIGGPVYYGGPRPFHFFGRTVIISSGGRVGYIFGVVFLVMWIMATVILGGNFANYKSKLKEEQTYHDNLIAESRMYEDMIKDKVNSSLYTVTDATYAPIYYGDFDDYNDNFISKHTGVYYYGSVGNVGYYFITFSYTSQGTQHFGQTYASFTRESADVDDLFNRNIYNSMTLKPGDRTLEVVFKNSDYSVVINTDYKAEDNSEIYESEFYISNFNSDIKNATIALIVLCVIDAVIIAVLVISFVITVKKSKLRQQAEAEEKQREAEDRAEARKQKYCMYCGALIDPEDEKCPNCGSSQIVKK